MNTKFLFLYILIFLIPFIAFGKKKDKGGALTDSTQVIIHDIFVGGNKKTKTKIINRELLFQQGDTVYKQYLDNYITKSKDNLLNTSLFNYVTINTIEDNPNQISIYVIVEERWYLWPYVIFENADRNLSAFIHNKDWSRINYGLMLVKNNFRGRGETVKFKFRLGYKEQFQIAYEVPYLGKYRQHGLSADFSMFRQHEISYITKNDAPVYFKDENKFATELYNARLTYQYRHRHFLRHNFTLSYNYSRVQDTIIKLNPNYFGHQDNYAQFCSLSYNLSYDKRNYKLYPLSGYNFELTLTQNGLNLLPDELSPTWEIRSQAYYYIDLQNRWYTGFGANGKVSTNKKQPYFIEQALGYGDYLRAFEYNVIDGQSFATGRAFIKYAIVPLQIKYIENWGWSKFNKIHYSIFADAFIDSGYVYDVNPYTTNTLSNKFLASAGIGIDLVAYYDQILRLEYSINRFGYHGIFLHIGKAF